MYFSGKRSLLPLTRISLCLLVMLFLFIAHPLAQASAALFKTVPQQNTYEGRNTNVYSPHGQLTQTQREHFIHEISSYAVRASAKWDVPASVIVGMAALESGYGSTQIAYYANNLFGIKVWNGNASNAWQLIGQPDEDFARPVPVLADYGHNRKVFDETNRRDNWYRIFSSYQAAVDYLAGTLLQNSRYGPSLNEYKYRVTHGWGLELAAKQYLYDIADAGYNHLGGHYYRNAVSRVIDQWDLWQLDHVRATNLERIFMEVNDMFTRAAAQDVFVNPEVQAIFVMPIEGLGTLSDIWGHWAQEAIERLASLGIISGFPDGTFRPEESVTREQFIKMIVEALGYTPVEYSATFLDVSRDRWSKPFVESAVAQGFILPSEHGAKLNPASLISRHEMTVMASRAALKPGDITSLPFDDMTPTTHTNLIAAAVNAGLIKGFTDNTFRPQDYLTRAQAAKVVSRIIHLQAN